MLFSNEKSMAHQCAMLFKRKSMAHQCAMLFKRKSMTSAHAFQRGSMAHQCAAISHTCAKKAVAESSSATADVSVPNLRSQTPTHPPSLLAHAAGRRPCQKIPPRAFLPSHGLPPTMAAFRRKAAQLQIQLQGKPRTLTGFLLIPPATQRSDVRDDDTMYAFICTKYHAGLQLSMPFSLPSAFFAIVLPKIRIETPRRCQALEGGGCGCGPTPV